MLTRANTYLERPCDRREDECDGCHDLCAVWEDFDEPGEWQFCASCIRKMEDKRNAGMKRWKEIQSRRLPRPMP